MKPTAIRLISLSVFVIFFCAPQKSFGQGIETHEIRVGVVYTSDAESTITHDAVYGTVNNDIADHAEQIAIFAEDRLSTAFPVTEDVDVNVVHVGTIDYNENGTNGSVDSDVTQSSNNQSTTAVEINDNKDVVMVDGRTVEEMMDDEAVDILIVVTDTNVPPGSPEGTVAHCCGSVARIETNPDGNPDNSVVVLSTTSSFGGSANDGAHEIGHLAGAVHEDDDITQIPEDSARGIIIEDSNGDAVAGTIMVSDECVSANGCSQLPTFSNKDQTVEINGVVYPRGDDDHDAAATIKIMIPKIADYSEVRNPPPPPPLPPPPTPISWNNNHFVYCHQPQCALWDMRASGGLGASLFNIKRSFSIGGTYTTIQTETNINYFNVHGSDQNMYWKVCGLNEGGETCSPPFRTRVECEVGGGGPY